MNRLLISAAIEAADDLTSAIDGTTDQFEPEVARLAEAIRALDLALASKAGTHTAGPWTTWRDFDEEGPADRTVIGKDGEPLFCSCLGTAPADITLATAAPDLLAALEYQDMADADPQASRRKGYFDSARELRAAAIAKARGLA
jgi:hypothetical protein